MPLVLLPAPYITPEILTQASTGISWQTIPSRNSTAQQQVQEQWNICRRATAMIDTEVNQQLRAVVSTETLACPDYRVTVQNNSVGGATVMLARKPVLEVVSGQIAPLVPPLNYRPIPSNAFAILQPSPGQYGSTVPGEAAESGQKVILAPGYVSWTSGRFGQMLSITYVSGYPHAALTADTAAGSTSLQVSDVSGWAPITSNLPGAIGQVYDAANQEAVSVAAASATQGGGTLLLQFPTVYSHQAGTLISAMPSQIMQAAILFCMSQALMRGATATGVQTVVPGLTHGDSPEAYASEAELLCKPYRRMT